MRTRFAPSPTGYLHLGHALAAKEAFGFAQDRGGECLLRIEDIDHTRCRPEYMKAIYEDLAWLGFDWPNPVRVQSKHLTEYEAVINSLRDRGLLYRCFRSRTELKDSPPSPLSKANELAFLDAEKAFALRLNMQRVMEELKGRVLSYHDTDVEKFVDMGALEDVVLARKDIGTSYHIAVTHDDNMQGITHVVRGADFIDQTPYHIVIQHLMGWPTPIYHHHKLLLRADGEKLSKRQKDITIRSLREKGMTPEQVLAMALSPKAG